MNGTSIFDAIDKILSGGVLEEGDAHLLLLAGIRDLNVKIERSVIIAEEKNKAQQIVNEKVSRMWPVHKATLWIWGIVILGVFGLLFDAITVTIG